MTAELWGGPVVGDVRTWVDGSTTVQVWGLDAKATEVAATQFELGMLVANGLRSAGDALTDWRGVHAETFVDDANDLFVRLVSVARAVSDAGRALAAWPDIPANDPAADETGATAQVEVPPHGGTSSADPDKLDDVRLWCESVCERLPGLAALDLDGVTAEVTRRMTRPALLVPTPGDGFPAVDPWEPRFPLLGEPDPVETTTTYGVDPATYVALPDLSGSITTVVEAAGQLGAWTGVVALAFRYGDPRLLDLIEAYPHLADELLSGFDDTEIGAESALVILLAYFDLFDQAKTGEEDGEVSLDDLWVMTCSTDLPPYVAAAAAYLHDDPTLFDLIETIDDDMTYARDVVGGNGDGKISRRDIENFRAFNDHIETVEQNFSTFDTAAHPDGDADGKISVGDLEAMAGGEGRLAEAASWLLDHSGALRRAGWYHDAKAGFLGPVSGETTITAASLALLAVDQHVYTDRPNAAAGFVDRRFETLMNADVGGLAGPHGMTAVFDSALTKSDQRGPLLDRVIAEVADDGTIHNTGLHSAFANGVAANMALVDDHINAPSAHLAGEVPDEVRDTYLATHDFLREVSRDPDAALRLREAVFDYGLTEVQAAPDAGHDRQLRLKQLGRVQGFLDVAQDNALTGAALDEVRASAERSGPGPSLGSVTNYAIGHMPVLGTVNGIADGMGIGAGAGMDWLLQQLDVDAVDAFDRLSDAEKVDRVRRAESNIDRAVWVAVDRLASDPTVHAAALGQPFVNDDGTLKTDMSPQEMQAFREWATSLVGSDRDPGPLWEDEDDIDAGQSEATSPEHSITIEGRQ